MADARDSAPPRARSVIEWLHATYDIPRWGGWAVLGTGALLAARGFGLPIGFASDPPWLAITEAPPPQAMLQALGGGLVLLGGLALVPFRRAARAPISAPQPAEPGVPVHAPSRADPPPATQPPNIPRLVLTTPLSTDEAALEAALALPQDAWRSVEIAWPASAEQLVALVRTALERLDATGSDAPGAELFLREGPAALAMVDKRRRHAKACIAGFAQRSRSLPERERTAALRGLLLLANLRVHEELAFLSGWQGLTALGLEAPGSWKPFQIPSPDRRTALVLRDGFDATRIVSARLRRIGTHELYTAGGSPGIYLEVPDSGFRPMQAIDPDVVAHWLMPQLEWASDRVDLPERYAPGDSWLFDKDSTE